VSQGCRDCGKGLGRRNRSGFCRACCGRNSSKSPEWRERQRAGVIRSLMANPERKEELVARARRLSADPEMCRRRMEAAHRTRPWEKAAKASQDPEVRARAGRSISATRLAWCPPHLRDHYRYLLYSQHIKAAEARQMIEEMHEAEMVRFRRKHVCPGVFIA
jgi:hypothetical protein